VNILNEIKKGKQEIKCSKCDYESIVIFQSIRKPIFVCGKCNNGLMKLVEDKGTFQERKAERIAKSKRDIE